MELTLKARELIGKDLNIKDKKSPIIKNKNKFTDRMSLLEPFVYVRDMIETYNEELNRFKSESEYIKFIEDSEKELYSYIENLLDDTLKIESVLRKHEFKPTPALKTDVITEDFVDSAMLEIGVFDNEIYEAIKYKVIQDKLPLTQKEFLEKHCKCKYLVVRNKLELDKFSKHHQSIIKIALDEISNIIMSKVSSVINNKQLMHVGNGKVIYSVPFTLRVGTLLDLHECLDIKCLGDLNIECIHYILEKPGTNSELYLKRYSNGEIRLAKYSDAELISFMRNISKEEITKDDLVIEINNTYCKLNKPLNINWEFKL